MRFSLFIFHSTFMILTVLFAYGAEHNDSHSLTQKINDIMNSPSFLKDKGIMDIIEGRPLCSSIDSIIDRAIDNDNDGFNDIHPHMNFHMNGMSSDMNEIILKENNIKKASLKKVINNHLRLS
jgi:hypothetical protein